MNQLIKRELSASNKEQLQLQLEMLQRNFRHYFTIFISTFETGYLE